MGGDRLVNSNIIVQVGKQIYKDPEVLKGHSLIGLMSGQGELKPQMGLHFLDMRGDPYVAHVFDMANQLFYKWNPERGTDFNFRAIIEKGSESDISQTAIAQPILVILSLLSKYVLGKNFNVKPNLLAGHSAGEYSALAENCLDLDTALEVIIARGRITQEEVQRSIEQGEPQTAMYALKRKKSPIVLDEIYTILEKIGMLPPSAVLQEPSPKAGYSLINGKNDLVVWSEDLHFELLEASLKSHDIRMINLNIPTAFHADTPTMHRIAARMKGMLESQTWRDPETPILMNATHRVASTSDEVRASLIANHTRTVDWLECMQEISHNGVDAAVQFGPGSFLAKQIEQIIPGVVTEYSDLLPKQT